MKLDRHFWDNKYKNRETGWDVGYVSTPIKTYIDQLNSQNVKILVPGAGNGYEAAYLISKGFNNTHILDISSEAISRFKKRCPSMPDDRIHCTNFFDHEGDYDIIIEQTFFCALTPDLRPDYVQKMAELLRQNNGKLVGLLFDFPLTEEGPPFGGSLEAYKSLFSPYFDIRVMERCRNSIAPRDGHELFINLEVKQ